MSRKATAGQFSQIGQCVIGGLTPTREELQTILGNPEITRLLTESGKNILGPALTALRGNGVAPTVPKSDLLEPVTVVHLPAVEAFSAKDSFKKDGKAPRGVKIGWLGDNFTRHFLDGRGKNEIDVSEATLRVNRLRRNSVDGPIIKELGGEEAVETSLAHMFELMAAQPTGQSGPLLVNGYANIFYVRDSAGTLWAVLCDWDAYCDGWSVGARSVASPRAWCAGRQVFSR